MIIKNLQNTENGINSILDSFLLRKYHILTSSSVEKWDFFISHASEDKDSVATPLAEALIYRGYEVWYDEFTLTLGDSLREKIDYGIAHSNYGILILSPNFFSKTWPQRELNAFVASETVSKKLLPVWHNLDIDIVRQYSPILADRIAIKSTQGINKIVDEVIRATRSVPHSIAVPSRNSALVASISSSLLNKIHRISENGYPEMTGGFLLGKQGTQHWEIIDAIEIENPYPPPERSHYYATTPKDFMKMEDEADDRNLTIIGLFSNVADAPASMSTFDRDHALPNSLNLRTSVQSGTARDTKAWKLTDDRVKFESVSLRVT